MTKKNENQLGKRIRIWILRKSMDIFCLNVFFFGFSFFKNKKVQKKKEKKKQMGLPVYCEIAQVLVPLNIVIGLIVLFLLKKQQRKLFLPVFSGRGGGGVQKQKPSFWELFFFLMCF